MQRGSLQRCLSAVMLSLYCFLPGFYSLPYGSKKHGRDWRVKYRSTLRMHKRRNSTFPIPTRPSARLRHFRLGAKVETALRQHYQVSLNLNPSGTKEQSIVLFESFVGQNKKFRTTSHSTDISTTHASISDITVNQDAQR